MGVRIPTPGRDPTPSKWEKLKKKETDLFSSLLGRQIDLKPVSASLRANMLGSSDSHVHTWPFALIPGQPEWPQRQHQTSAKLPPWTPCVTTTIKKRKLNLSFGLMDLRKLQRGWVTEPESAGEWIWISAERGMREKPADEPSSPSSPSVDSSDA